MTAKERFEEAAKEWRTVNCSTTRIAWVKKWGPDENCTDVMSRLARTALVEQQDNIDQLNACYQSLAKEIAAKGQRITEIAAEKQKLVEYGVKLDGWNDELQKRIAELEADLVSTREAFATVVRAVKKARGHTNWPEHGGVFLDFVVSEIAELEGLAEASGIASLNHGRTN